MMLTYTMTMVILRKDRQVRRETILREIAKCDLGLDGNMWNHWTKSQLKEELKKLRIIRSGIDRRAWLEKKSKCAMEDYNPND